MKTIVNNAQLMDAMIGPNSGSTELGETDRQETLKAIYTQLFKENRDLDFFHNSTIDSKYLSGETTVRETVEALLSSEMYRDYILMVNSNYHFVTICFERVLGRSPLQSEIFKWSSLLASSSLENFAASLTSSTEYMEAFGEDEVPCLRSGTLFTSNQNTPALPMTQSLKRYTGPGNDTQWDGCRINTWGSNEPPKIVRKAGAVFAVAGTIEMVRIAATIVLAAFSTGSF